MIIINPVKFNKSQLLSFKEGNLNNITPSMAILSLQNPNAGINFENDIVRTKRSDIVQSNNIFDAIGEKLRKTYNIIFTQNHDTPKKTEHISYYG